MIEHSQEEKTIGRRKLWAMLRAILSFLTAKDCQGEQALRKNRTNRKMTVSSRHKQLLPWKAVRCNNLILAGGAPFMPRFSATPP